MSNNRFEIKTVPDFLEIPADKIDECLSDFSAFLKLMKSREEIEGLLNQLADTSGAFKTNTETFVWVDDGERGVSAIEFQEAE